MLAERVTNEPNPRLAAAEHAGDAGRRLPHHLALALALALAERVGQEQVRRFGHAVDGGDEMRGHATRRR